ncbi:MAG: HNH endonuclease [Candidatus Doudnabacteria bacterium]
MAFRDKTRKTIQPALRKRVYIRDKYICGYCGVRKKSSSLNVDHIIPVSKGGYDGIENFVTACKNCNHTKFVNAPRVNGAPKLGWHSGRKVAKVTIMSKNRAFLKRIPKISYIKVNVRKRG